MSTAWRRMLQPSTTARRSAWPARFGGRGFTTLTSILALVLIAASQATAGAATVVDSGVAHARPGDVVAALSGSREKAAAAGHRLGLVLVPAPELDRLGYVRFAAPSGHRFPELRRALLQTGAVTRVERNFAAHTTASGRGQAGERHAEVLIPGLARVWTRGLGARRVRVALLDTGVDRNHAELVPALGEAVNVSDDELGLDRTGHGTMQAGVLAARHDGRGVGGIAPGCTLLAVKVAGRGGEGSQVSLARGIVWAADHGAQVLCIPMGSRVGSGVLEAAVAYATGRGALLVAAAGNRNVDHQLYPAAYPEVVSVAAGDGHARLSFHTALGPDTELLAPGRDLPTTRRASRFGVTSGTSAATAYVAGLAALLLSSDARPGATAVRRALYESGHPVEAVAAVAPCFALRAIDPDAALARVDRTRDDTALERLRVSPRRPLPGRPVTVVVRARNAGPREGRPRIARLTAPGAPPVTLPVPVLRPGEGVDLAATFVVPATPGAVAGSLTASLEGGDDDASNDIVRSSWTPAEAPVSDVGFTDLEPVRLDPDLGEVRVVARLANRGSVAAHVRFESDDAAVRLVSAPRAGAPGESEASVARSATLAPGESVRVEARARRGRGKSAAVAGRLATVRIRAVLLGASDAHPEDNVCGVSWAPEASKTPAEPPVRPQYQQSGDVTWIVDAPWRVAPGRPYLPLLVFLPEKGDVDPSTTVVLNDLTVRLRDPSGQLGPTIFRDSHTGPPTVAVPGTELLDEDGAPKARLDPFDDQELRSPGRYTILRLPRAAFGVGTPTATPAAPAASAGAPDPIRRVDVQLAWTSRRFVFLSFTSTRTGTLHRGLEVTFASRDFPTIGAGRYFDAHVHTIAEWSLDDTNPVGPRKAFGGPIPMLDEAAWCQGLTPQLGQVRGRIITTDHNSFYNRQPPGSDSVFERPPFGPTSVARSRTPSGAVKSELERMREIFGRTAGEEVTFSQQVGTYVSVPLGAHILVYDSEHFEGPWHGGSDVASQLFGDPRRLELDAVLSAVGTQRAGARAPFAFAAHPNDYNPWSQPAKDLALGLGAHRGSAAFLAADGSGFVYKGRQVWNGRPARVMDPDAVSIDFTDLDPYAEPSFVAGDPGWDGRVWSNLAEYHRDLAELARYELATRPGVVFPRKELVIAGTDAHGDFNCLEDRFATNLPLPSTFTVEDTAFGKVRTYVRTDAQPGATEDERALSALASGSSVVTDGPLLWASVDANGRFDSTRLAWHDRSIRYEDADGRLGGGGTFDGAGTALVVSGDDAPVLRYRYEGSADGGSQGGAVGFVKIYRTREGSPNPTVRRKVAGHDFDLPLSVGSLAAAGAGQDQDHVLDPQREGRIDREVTVLQLGAFTGTQDPDLGPLGTQERRCFTNPIWLVPVTVDTQVRFVDRPRREIPPGGLELRFAFGMSMTPHPYRIEIKGLDHNGDSTDRGTPALGTLEPFSAWGDHRGAHDAWYVARNTRAIPLPAESYPAPGQVSFVCYFAEPPRDAHGNALDPVGVRVTVSAPTGAGSVGPQTAATQASGGGGGGGGGGCGLGARTGGAGGRIPLPGLLLVLLLLLLQRRRTRLRRRLSVRGGETIEAA